MIYFRFVNYSFGGRLRSMRIHFSDHFTDSLWLDGPIPPGETINSCRGTCSDAETPETYVTPVPHKRSVTTGIGSSRSEIDITALWVGVYQLYRDAIANIEVFSALHQHAFDVRIKSANESSVIGNARDDGLVGLADVRM